jgi:hypothetical protein
MYLPIPYLKLLRVRERIRETDPNCKEWLALLSMERYLDAWCRDFMGADYLRIAAGQR